MKQNTRHWIQMKTFLFLKLLFFTGFPVAVQATEMSTGMTGQQLSVQVVNIFENGTIETIAPSGKRQKVQLAGIQAISFPNQVKSATAKRLKTLILGKTVLIQTTGNQHVLMSLGGMDIASRIVSEGVALIEERSLKRLPMSRQQQLISAEEYARQYRRGIWQQQRPALQQRFHHPLWPADRLPSPVTKAPVYRPDTK